jgi:four helix bundle protein
MDLLQKKAYDFALRIVRLSEYLQNEKKEFILSKKVLDSGTNIGLLIEEGKQGDSRPEFIQRIRSRTKKHSEQTFFCACCVTQRRSLNDTQAQFSKTVKNFRRC